MNDNLRLRFVAIERKTKTDRCTLLQRLRLSHGFALAELPFSEKASL